MSEKKNALILHGIHSTSKDNWFPWLKRELESLGWSVMSPDLPDSKHPARKEWLSVLRNLTKDIDFSTLTIFAHSLGVPAALDLIETEGKKIDSLVSVAGFAVPYGFEPNEYFMKERVIDLAKIKKLISKPFVIYSDDDPYVTQGALAALAEGLVVRPVVVSGGKHFNSKAGYDKFPLLLELIDR